MTCTSTISVTSIYKHHGLLVLLILVTYSVHQYAIVDVHGQLQYILILPLTSKLRSRQFDQGTRASAYISSERAYLDPLIAGRCGRRLRRARSTPAAPTQASSPTIAPAANPAPAPTKVAVPAAAGCLLIEGSSCESSLEGVSIARGTRECVCCQFGRSRGSAGTWNSRLPI